MLKLVHKIQNVTGASAQPVELDDHQRVARPDEIEDGLKLAAAVTRSSSRLFGTHERAACVTQLASWRAVSCESELTLA